MICGGCGEIVADTVTDDLTGFELCEGCRVRCVRCGEYGCDAYTEDETGDEMCTQCHTLQETEQREQETEHES